MALQTGLSARVFRHLRFRCINAGKNQKNSAFLRLGQYKKCKFEP